jgi:hypothetical protein
MENVAWGLVFVALGLTVYTVVLIFRHRKERSWSGALVTRMFRMMTAALVVMGLACFAAALSGPLWGYFILMGCLSFVGALAVASLWKVAMSRRVTEDDHV